jgi:hypothetical protein
MNTDTAARSDLDALIALNRDYIHSVQHGDVQRFDEILAEDFLRSNFDGSLVDKKQFLVQTARPVTIGGLAAQGVRVRTLAAWNGVIAGAVIRRITSRLRAVSAVRRAPGGLGFAPNGREPRLALASSNAALLPETRYVDRRSTGTPLILALLL